MDIFQVNNFKLTMFTIQEAESENLWKNLCKTIMAECNASVDFANTIHEPIPDPSSNTEHIF